MYSIIDNPEPTPEPELKKEETVLTESEQDLEQQFYSTIEVLEE